MADFNLFTDRRESDAARFTAFRITRERGIRGWNADQTLAELRRVDFTHPALVVYREDDDDRWSYVMVGLSSLEQPQEGREPSFLDGY